MAQITAIASNAAAVAYDAALSTPIDSAGYSSIVVSADALAAAEEVDIYMQVGPVFLPVIDEAGVVQKLTYEIYMLRLIGGPTYRFGKAATAAACGVFVDLCR